MSGKLTRVSKTILIKGDTRKVEMPSREMEVVKGQMVVLQAWYSPSSDISQNTVIWHFTGNDSKQVINFSSGKVGHGQNEFTNRVGFSVAMPSANLSIYINNTQETDSGLYFCHVIVPGGHGISGELRLNVKASNAGMIAATTLGSVVGLVAMVLILIFILKRRQDTEEEMANEIKEDAQAPKRVSWAKSNTGSDIVSKNGTLSSIATSPRSQDQPKFPYPYSPISASDTGSVIHAYQLRPGTACSLQGLPGYNMGGTPLRKHKRPPSANGGPPQILRSPAVGTPLKRTEGPQPQVPAPVTVSPQISSSTLTRTGAVAVMVPAQSQAGSLV
ncbi:hypothetical protein XENOCAPTIV_027049 [Xenoophorus captivus]|uniref:Immunoglobulin domain-containing protein n=1 Tax=Xenoophorus captivus TaxID=1517983 RepID=A0ABV0SE17_9TELE